MCLAHQADDRLIGIEAHAGSQEDRAPSAIFMAPGVRFDADQAVVGLMAAHISEGRAFPVFFYGQSYLLAVEAYLAAPVMWLLGPTEVALKLPLLAMNAAAALLAVAARATRAAAGLAFVAALPSPCRRSCPARASWKPWAAT